MLVLLFNTVEGIALGCVNKRLFSCFEVEIGEVITLPAELSFELC